MKHTTPAFPLRPNRLSKSLAGFALTALFAIGATAQVAVGTTGIDASHTGTAGLAGLLAVRDEVRGDERVAVIFSGIRR